MTGDPTTGELSRRIDGMDSRFDSLTGEIRDMGRSINERFDRMPTSELLTAYLAKTDTEVAALKKDVSDIEIALPLIEKRIVEAKRWAIGALISGGGVLVAALGLIRSLA